jgi:HSP20 family protein
MSLIRRDPDFGLTTWDPFGFGDWGMGFDNMFRRLENLERTMMPELYRGGTLMERGGVRIPNVDFKETSDKYQIVAEMPGIDRNNIKIDLDEDRRMLTLSGEQKEEKEQKDERYHFRERTYGSFRRTFRLPDNVKMDQIKATMNHGLLSIDLPKSEVKTETKRKRSINIGE